MSKSKDLTGKRFGRLTVIRRYGKNKYNKILWLCKCDCGSNIDVITTTGNLNSNNTKSCGCIQKETAIKTILDNIKGNTYIETEKAVMGTDGNDNKFYFDKEDMYKIKNLNRTWHINNEGYVVTKFNKTYIKMHRFLLNIQDSHIQIDHINGNRSDNRKSNLRICTQSENACNKGLFVNNKSGVKGVIWSKFHDKWRAYITKNNKRIHLGYFDEFSKAVESRKQAEETYFGEFNRKT